MGNAFGELSGEGQPLVVRAGDPPAVLRAFFDAALDAAYPYLARRCGGDSTLVEDLTQDTFVTAVRALRSGSVDHLTIGWIVTVAQSRLVDHYRREVRLSRHLRVVGPAEHVDRVDDAVIAEGMVVELLAHLPAAQRLDVVLHHLDGVPVGEIAERTGRTERAVESSLARGRRTLRARMLEETS
jgi:RNA polymerase sigma-70 factor (ECF subfamily)